MLLFLWLGAVIDCQNAGAVNGAKSALAPSEAKLMLRERWLLYVQCAESKVRNRLAATC